MNINENGGFIKTTADKLGFFILEYNFQRLGFQMQTRIIFIFVLIVFLIYFITFF